MARLGHGYLRRRIGNCDNEHPLGPISSNIAQVAKGAKGCPTPFARSARSQAGQKLMPSVMPIPLLLVVTAGLASVSYSMAVYRTPAVKWSVIR